MSTEVLSLESDSIFVKMPWEVIPAYVYAENPDLYQIALQHRDLFLVIEEAQSQNPPITEVEMQKTLLKLGYPSDHLESQVTLTQVFGGMLNQLLGDPKEYFENREIFIRNLRERFACIAVNPSRTRPSSTQTNRSAGSIGRQWGEYLGLNYQHYTRCKNEVDLKTVFALASCSRLMNELSGLGERRYTKYRYSSKRVKHALDDAESILFDHELIISQLFPEFISNEHIRYFSGSLSDLIRCIHFSTQFEESHPLMVYLRYIQGFSFMKIINQGDREEIAKLMSTPHFQENLRYSIDSLIPVIPNVKEQILRAFRNGGQQFMDDVEFIPTIPVQC